MIITVKRLRKLQACKDQTQLFQELFGSETEVTIEKCLSVYDKFDWTWAANALLPKSASAEYKKVRDAARAKYNKVCDAAWAEYNKVRARAFGELASKLN